MIKIIVTLNPKLILTIGPMPGGKSSKLLKAPSDWIVPTFVRSKPAQKFPPKTLAWHIMFNSVKHTVFVSRRLACVPLM